MTMFSHMTLRNAERDMWPLVVAVDVGGPIGFGHLRRCIAICSEARLIGAQVSFELSGGDIASGCRLVEMSGFDCKSDPGEVAAGMIKLVDRVHSAVLRQPNLLVADITRWRSQGTRVVVIDGAGKDSLRYQRPDLDVDLFIAPYAGERSNMSKSTRLLAGPEFAPLGTEYENLAPREIRTAAKQILVSCGGSDPFEITAMIIKALAIFESRRLMVRVALGPGFEPVYRARLLEMARNSRHTFEWIEAPDSLALHMCWSDLAVTTSGLTKYELAATGTPAILISPDAIHARANEPFAALETALDLGSAEDLTLADIATALCVLLDDTKRRSAMARAGQSAVNGRGAARIAGALGELAYAGA
jgi:UDP-2,4-diacetamido-2,4,6-trideoxy-beta-L-altropyranose hydrolase